MATNTPDVIEALVLDLLESIAVQPQPYAEVMSAWRTSCPRLPVWEEATARGFIERRLEQGVALVCATAAGREFLQRQRGPIRVRKAFAYITRGDRVLVFRQPAFPEAGVQVPAGTIRPEESPDRAALREAVEETGWSDFGEPSFLGRAEFDCSPFGKCEIHDRSFFHLETRGTPPETWQHHEADPHGGGTAEPIEFSFFWIPVLAAERELIADHGRMLPELRKRLRV